MSLFNNMKIDRYLLNDIKNVFYTNNEKNT